MADRYYIEAELLPQSLAEVIDAVGMAPAMALVERAGGTRVYVPERIDGEHPLAQWMGLDAAQALVERFGTDTLDVPRCLAGMRMVRDRRIRAERRAGASIRDLALRYRLTMRQVYTILASGDQDDAGAARDSADVSQFWLF